MAKFLEGTSLNDEIKKILSEAEKEIIIISPFIKLHHLYIEQLKAKKSHTSARYNARCFIQLALRTGQ